MSYIDPSEIPQSRMNPSLLMGAASPLWSYFAAATAGGLAFWWMTRWSRPVNFEAVLNAAAPSAARESVIASPPEPAMQAEPEPALALLPVPEAVPLVPDPAPAQTAKARKFTAEVPEIEA